MVKSRWAPTQRRSESLTGEGQSVTLRPVMTLALKTQPDAHGGAGNYHSVPRGGPRSVENRVDSLVFAQNTTKGTS